MEGNYMIVMNFGNNILDGNALKKVAAIIAGYHDGGEKIVVTVPKGVEKTDILRQLLTAIGIPYAYIDMRQTEETASGLIISERVKNTIQRHIDEAQINNVLPIIAFAASSPYETMAALVASSLDAKELWLWSDIDGIYTDDPEKNPHAEVFALITYEEAYKMAREGKMGLDDRTLMPMKEKNILLRFKNALHPDHMGTMIHEI